MFEHAMLDNARQRRSKWSWMGLVVQAGLVTGMLLVPMVSPEILGVMLPKAMIYVPVKQVAPVEVEVQTASSSRTNVPNTVVAVRPAYRPFTAPRAYNNPIASIIDGNDYNPPAFTIGAPVNFANSAPFAGTGSALPSAPPPKLAPTVRKDPVRVGGDVQAANILSRVKPVYPPLAKQARISGSVKLEGVIAKDGTVQRLKVISGHPFLVPAAVEAVKQWRYRPTHLNGEPVEVLAPIDVNFILSN